MSMSDTSVSDEDIYCESRVMPYKFVPSYSQEEMEQRRKEKSQQSVSTETYGELSLGSKCRTSERFWCSCDRCVCLPTETECICCQEVPQAHHIVDKFSPVPDNNDCDYQQKCVTFHPDFDAHLNAGVLDTYFRSHSNNWRRFPKPKGPGGTLINAQYRLVAYRFILDWLLQGKILGKKKRIPLPACIVNVICAKYPADDEEYAGFKYAELPTV